MSPTREKKKVVKKTFMSFRVDAETREALLQLADERERPMSDILRRAVKRFKRYHDKQRAARAAEREQSTKRRRAS